MPLHPNFPESPHVIIDPSVRWTPDPVQLRLIGSGMLLPPLVQKLREEVKTWRNNNYNGSSDTSRALLNWWFNTQQVKNRLEPQRIPK